MSQENEKLLKKEVNGEINDEELDAVAGGSTVCGTVLSDGTDISKPTATKNKVSAVVTQH
jgi:hypothetical protein